MTTRDEAAETPFTAEEQARRRAIIEAMLSDRDRRESASMEEILRWRDEGRP